MKKSIKRLTLALVLALVVAALGLFAVGCGDNTPPEELPAAKAYTVKVVYTDGTAVDGTKGTGGPDESTVMVQICHLNANGETVNCYNKTALSANGEWSVEASKLPELKAGEKFHVEIDGLPAGCSYDATAANTYFTAPGTTTITVTKTEEEPEPDKKQTFTVSAKDSSGKAVADAWLEMFYYADAVNYGDPTVVGTAKTDENGVAKFEIEPVDGTDYYVQSAGHGEKVTDPAVNYKYSPTDMNAKFDGKAATFTYDYYPNAFNANYAKIIKYSRVYKDGNAVEADDNEALTLSLAANEYTYFYFNPYVAPDAEEASEEDTANAQAAASGIYQITFAVDPNTADVTMYYYNSSYIDMNTHMPSQIGNITGTAPSGAENAELYTESATVELELKTDALNAKLFSIVAKSACSVTVSVNRTGNAAAIVERTLVNKTSEATKEWTEADMTEDGTLTPVPLNNPVTVTKDANGYYHYGNAEGPIVYVTLTRPLSRANGKALSKLSEIQPDGGAPLGDAAYYFDATDNETEKYNFAPMIATYAALVKNDDGVYPLTDELKEFLTYFGNSTYNFNPFYGANNWLTPCQYFDAAKSANELQEGNNVITLADQDERYNVGKEYTFTSVSGGTYVISFVENENDRGMVTDASFFNIYIGSDDNGDLIESYEFTLAEGETFKFTMWELWGSEGDESFSFTVKIENADGSDEEDDDKIALGETVIADTDGYSLPYTLAVPQSGWYIFSLPSTDNLSLTIFEDEDDFFGTMILDYSEEGEEGKNYSLFPLYLEAGEYSLDVMSMGGTTLTFAATDKPTFTIGGEGTELTGYQGASITLSLESTEEANYTITIIVGGRQQPDITVTIDGTEYTFGLAEGYTVENVTIAAGANITVSGNASDLSGMVIKFEKENSSQDVPASL